MMDEIGDERRSSGGVMVVNQPHKFFMSSQKFDHIGMITSPLSIMNFAANNDVQFVFSGA